MAARQFPPRLMQAPAAAYYLGVGETKLRTLPIPRRVFDGNRVSHINDLDAYPDSLPIEGESKRGPRPCDDVFSEGASA